MKTNMLSINYKTEILVITNRKLGSKHLKIRNTDWWQAKLETTDSPAKWQNCKRHLDAIKTKKVCESANSEGSLLCTSLSPSPIRCSYL